MNAAVAGPRDPYQDGQPQVLRSVAIPHTLRGFDTHPHHRTFDVHLAQGQVQRINPSDADEPKAWLISAPVDLHTHLDKSYTVGEVGAAQGDLGTAIARMAQHRSTWTADDLHQRMSRALQDAWQHGTRALRTHLDWVEAPAPLALAEFEALRHAWRGRMELQCAALVPLDVLDDIRAGARIAATLADFNQRAGTRDAALMGAFIYRNERMDDKLHRLFQLATQHNLSLDLHVDEGLDADARGLARVAQLTTHYQWGGRVVAGHACSLMAQPRDEALRTLVACQRAGVHLVALPTTNAYLQGSWQDTPLERGITRLREAWAHQMTPSVATDNVADPFYPYGCYDLLESWSLAVQLAHLTPAHEWLAAITTHPAQAMGLPWDGRLRVGAPADLLMLHAADPWSLIPPGRLPRTVIRAGQVATPSALGPANPTLRGPLFA